MKIEIRVTKNTANKLKKRINKNYPDCVYTPELVLVFSTAIVTNYSDGIFTVTNDNLQPKTVWENILEMDEEEAKVLGVYEQIYE